MSLTVRGATGSGFVTIYDVPSIYAVQVESIKFQVDTDATGGAHSVRVRLVDPALGSIATLDDLNVGGPGQTNYYTYALGLNASACTLPSGLAVTDALPLTELAARGAVTVSAIDDTGTEIPGDAISEVVLQVSPTSDATAQPVDVGKITPAYFMAGSELV